MALFKTMTKAEEDFWNTSSHSGFNFDDEDDSPSVSSDHTVFTALTEISSELPIHAIISKNSLNIVLDDVNPTLQIMVPPAEETIKKMILLHNYNLQTYIRFNDKINLLEKALESCDANVIIKIILYLKETLKTNIFYHQLSKRKSAVKHYGHYLLLKNQLDELINLYMATGNISNMKYLYYLIGQGSINKVLLHRKLEQFIMEHLQKLNSNEDKAELYDNLQLIKFQVDKNSNSNSVVSQLVELCKIELSTLSGLERLQEFKKCFKIDDFTFDWTLLNVLASMQLWMHINDIFIKNVCGQKMEKLIENVENRYRDIERVQLACVHLVCFSKTCPVCLRKTSLESLIRIFLPMRDSPDTLPSKMRSLKLKVKEMEKKIEMLEKKSPISVRDDPPSTIRYNLRPRKIKQAQ